MKAMEVFRRLGRYELVFLATLLLVPTTSLADTNSWIKPGDGFWQETNSWSLGILPDSSQSLAITNSGEKTVTINSDTAQNFSESLIVNEITISGTNTLRLDHVGTNVPLQVLDGTNAWHELGVYSDATLLNFESGLVVGGYGGVLRIHGGNAFQDGGFVKANTTYIYGSTKTSHYFLTNGLYESYLDLLWDCFFNQYGGTAILHGLSLDGGSYNLFAGDIFNSGELNVSGREAPAQFVQEGGTNRIAGNLTVWPSYGGGPVSFTLNGGLLCTSNVVIKSGNKTLWFIHANGMHIITNTLEIQGEVLGHGTAPSSVFGGYSLSNGVLSARSIIFLSESSFSQTSGSTRLSESVQFVGSGNPYTFIGGLALSGGVFSCSDIISAGGATDISQSGGSLIVSNLFSFAGYAGQYDYYSTHKDARYVRYEFSAGTLWASNIELAAEMIIGSSTQIGRITNPGYFKMSGTLTVGDATEQLGRFILVSNSVIDLGDGSAKLTFADSNAESWDSAAKLFVTNWNGSLTGGYDQLQFGSDASALTATQLNQIRFVNPVGFPPGEYLAQILETGDVVPKASPSLSFGQSGTNFVLSWSSDFTLQTATNVSGPYEDLPAAISPYTNFSPEIPQRYFRLRR